MGPAKILSVGLGDLVCCRNAALRTAGFEVVSALCLHDLARGMRFLPISTWPL